MGHTALCLLLLILFAGCKEFYDDEFLEDQNSESTNSGNVTYNTTLAPTDPSLSTLSGDAEVDVQNDEVKVAINLKEIPQNIIQIHYAYSATPCSSLANSIPAELGTTRSVTISEDLTSTALNFDVTNSSGSTNLNGKTLVVRGFSNLQNAGTTGATVLNLACGELVATENTDGGASSDTTTPTTPVETDVPPTEEPLPLN